MSSTDGGGEGGCCGYVFPSQDDDVVLKVGDRTSSAGTESSLPEFKVILLGNSGVGKTAIVQRYDKDTFAKTHQATIGASFLSKEVALVDGAQASEFAFPSQASKGLNKTQAQNVARRVRLQIWDTAGEEKYRAMTSFYFRKQVDGCLKRQSYWT